MRCQEIREWFSPWLDGQLKHQEAQVLEEHLAQCEACRVELAEWQKTAKALQALAQETDGFSAPDGFELQVMQQIKQIDRRKRQVRGWLRNLVASAAALAILAYGSLGLIPRFGKYGPVNWIAEHSASDTTPSTSGNVNLPGEVANEDPRAKDPINNPEKPDSVETPLEEPAPGETEPATEGNTETVREGDPITPAEEAGKNTELDRELTVALAPLKEPLVFLNKERAITSTLLQLKVSDLEAAQASAKNAGNQAGAKYKTFALQTSNEGQRAIIRFTVPREKAKELVRTLSQLGYQLGQQEESQPITRRFTETLEQYRALVAQLNETKDPQLQAQLRNQVTSLEQQLTTWNEEAEEQIIMLSLEAN